MRIAGFIVIILCGISATVQAQRPSRSLDKLESADKVSDREQLVGAMLRRINHNFNRFTQ